jgi:X-X-X-Leu-X-X-Gly heptad repeat protein
MFKSVVVKRLILIFLACSAIVLALPSLSSAQQPDKSETLKKARRSYYSLKDEGLTEFQCTMAPNWAFLLAEQRKADPTGMDPAIQKLHALHFGLSLGLDGNAKVTHNELATENEQVASGLKQVNSGMEQMASGFFQTWSAHTISPALPDLTTTSNSRKSAPTTASPIKTAPPRLPPRWVRTTRSAL